uniref:Hydrolase_4 domain-containing protein n=1 Tax=Parastrongyloides trichosuri TaxID=131310 RepID=A0A0N5A5F0_PARTI
MNKKEITNKSVCNYYEIGKQSTVYGKIGSGDRKETKISINQKVLSTKNQQSKFSSATTDVKILKTTNTVSFYNYFKLPTKVPTNQSKKMVSKKKSVKSVKSEKKSKRQKMDAFKDLKKSSSNSSESDPKAKLPENDLSIGRNYLKHHLVKDNYDKIFLEKLEESKKKEYFIECNCIKEDSSWKCVRERGQKVWHNAKILFRIFFVLESDRNFTHKAIFWPQKTNYFFHKIKGLENSSFSEQLNSLKNILRDVTKLEPLNEITKPKIEQQYSNVIKCVANVDTFDGDFLFGHTHPCYIFKGNIRFFFLNDGDKNPIPCALTYSNTKPKYVIVYSHPNAYSLEDLVIGYPNLCDIAKFLKCEVLAYEYPGYGICDGKPTQEGLLNRLVAIYKYLTEDKEISPSKIIFLGYSLGGALSIMGASIVKNLGGVILFATPANFKSCVKYNLFCTDYVNSEISQDDPFQVNLHVERITCPTLIIHSKSDKIVPVSHSDVLFRHLQHPVKPLILEDVPHNYKEKSIKVWLRVKEFLYEDLPRWKSKNKSEYNKYIIT